MKEECIEIEGVISVVLPGTMFRVELNNKHLVLATISGKMRKRFVRLVDTLRETHAVDGSAPSGIAIITWVAIRVL